MQVCRPLLLLLCLGISSCSNSQNKIPHQSQLQYPAGYPTKESGALQQLQSYPLPRYFPNNHLLRLFNWIDPYYLGSGGQPGVPNKQVYNNSYLLQKELITDWNYGVVISNSTCAFNGQPGVPVEIQLANAYPNVSLDVITFWNGVQPKVVGRNGNRPMISNQKIDVPYAITYTRDGRKDWEIKFNFPDSLLHIDGEAQKFYISKLLKYLTRPINRINENGEEDPQPFLYKYIQNDPAMIRMKDSMKINSWEDFASTRKLQMRNMYSSAFMKELAELKNTLFTFYIVEGGPIDRFKWHTMKACMTPINGTYYSTPDFYPRWPSNWKDWQGAWHGWKWIEIGRKTEIKDGDKLFSPFVAAGWSRKYEDNITPGQWLGLLKCLSVVGAEFYYVGYFNLSAPFTNPADYVWQTAMPAYAQAITSRFEDVLRNGNVLFDNNNQPIISYPTDDKHVLITARKKDKEEKYVICGTYQPFSNDSNEIAEKRNVTVTINGHNLSFEVRRQGSVYVYEKTADSRTLFYQLDKWHENAHPEHWSKDFYFEAEVADSGITSTDIYTATTSSKGDYTNFTSYINLGKDKECMYNFSDRDSLNQTHVIWLRCKGKGELFIKLANTNGNSNSQQKKLDMENWQWVKITVPKTYSLLGSNSLKISGNAGNISLDKLVITTKENTAPAY